MSHMCSSWGLGSSNSLNNPVSVVNLLYMANFLEGGNCFSNDWDFLGPMEYLLDSDGLCIPRINDTFVVLYLNKDSLVVKDRPILLTSV
jgi:hypothetical protein